MKSKLKLEKIICRESNTFNISLLKKFSLSGQIKKTYYTTVYIPLSVKWSYHEFTFKNDEQMLDINFDVLLTA